MTIGRLFPQRNSNRNLPLDPQQNGDSNRIAPLLFQVQGSISTLYKIKWLLQTIVTLISTSGGGTAFVSGGCSQVTNQFCVPTATLTISGIPSAVLRCAIT